MARLAEHQRRSWHRLVLAGLVVASVVPWWSTSPAMADGILERIDVAAEAAAPGGLAPAVRLGVVGGVVSAPVVGEVEVASAAPLPSINRSTCRTDLPFAAMTITMPSIAYVCPVYRGSQAMLNSGAATVIADPGLGGALTDRPGTPGTLWIAGHRASHGGAFAAVPDLADGAIITVTVGDVSTSYRVVGRRRLTILDDQVVGLDGLASGAATVDAVIRPDHGGNGAQRLVLQTCDGDRFRWMVYADLVTD